MGFGLPAAIGAALAQPNRRVVCFTGDGSLLMNAQELATLAEEGLDVKIILFDNGRLGLVRQQQELFYGKNYMACEFRARTDYVALAQAFGIPARGLDTPESLGSILEWAFSARGPALISVDIDPNLNVFPMVPPGKSNREAIEA
jgi:acetolactate synthase-1/2/3 large subunit